MNTDVPGSPESCHAAADALALLARQLERAGRLATGGAHTSEADFDGRTADAYRAACAALAADASAHAATARRSAGALASYGEDLAAVQRVMERVRTSAGVHGLMQGTELVPPTIPTPHQRDVFERLSAIVADARAHLERARDRLSAAFPGQPFPADYGNVLLPPVGEPVEPFLFPPPESAWPREEQPDESRPDGPRREGKQGDGDCGAGRADRPEAPDERPDVTDGVDPQLDHAPEPEPRSPQDDRAGSDDTDIMSYRDPDDTRPFGDVLRPAPEPVP